MQTHLIQKQILQLQLHSQDQAWAQQEAILARLQSEGLQVMEEVFNQIAGADHFLRIDRLELDLGSLPLHASSETWKARFKTALINAIQQLQVEGEKVGLMPPTLSSETAAWEAWLFFLLHGHLPWWFAQPLLSAWEFSLLSFLQAAPAPRSAELLRLLRSSPQGLFRFFHQHSPAFQATLLKAIHHALPTLIEPWQKRIQDTAPPTWHEWLLCCWELVLTRSAEALVTRLTQIDVQTAHKGATQLDLRPEEIAALILDEKAELVHLRQRALPTHFEKGSDNQAGKQEEGVYIQNAGLVILAPFLPAFFEQLNIVSSGHFITPEAIDRATQLMHYLVFGRDSALEYELALAKVLCGLPEHYPLNANVPITDAERTEADALLRSVINHWSALGTCSDYSLQAMFLQREGKLMRNGADFFLQVENQTADILLNRLPWGFGMIKLPWMPGFLHTEWIY